MSRTGGQPDQLLLLACSDSRDSSVIGGGGGGGGSSNSSSSKQNISDVGLGSGSAFGSRSTVSVLYRMDMGVPLYTDRSVEHTHTLDISSQQPLNTPSRHTLASHPLDTPS